MHAMREIKTNLWIKHLLPEGAPTSSSTICDFSCRPFWRPRSNPHQSARPVLHEACPLPRRDNSEKKDGVVGGYAKEFQPSSKIEARHHIDPFITEGRRVAPRRYERVTNYRGDNKQQSQGTIGRSFLPLDCFIATVTPGTTERCRFRNISPTLSQLGLHVTGPPRFRCCLSFGVYVRGGGIHCPTIVEVGYNIVPLSM